MMTPEREANNNVTTNIGHEPASEPTRGLLSVFLFFTKNATPGASTE